MTDAPGKDEHRSLRTIRVRGEVQIHPRPGDPRENDSVFRIFMAQDTSSGASVKVLGDVPGGEIRHEMTAHVFDDLDPKGRPQLRAAHIEVDPQADTEMIARIIDHLPALQAPSNLRDWWGSP